MTLPFENDTSRIVKKYAKHSISQSRVKTFLSVLTIALAVALLSGFALSVIGMETEAKRELLVSSQMLYHNLNDEQMQTLRHDERISDSKIYMQAANTQIENYLVIFWTDISYYESVWLTLFFVVIQLAMVLLISIRLYKKDTRK